MNKRDLATYRKSIETITSTIGKTKYDLSNLSMLLIIYGLILLVFQSLNIIIGRLFYSTWNSTVFAYVGYGFILCLLPVFIIFRIREWRNNNKNVTKLYDLWGFVMFFLPITLYVARELTFDSLAAKEITDMYSVILNAMYIFTVIAALVFTGIVSENKNITFTAPFVMLIYVFYVVLYADTSKVDDTMLEILYTLRTSLWLVYLGLGVALWVTSRKKYKEEI